MAFVVLPEILGVLERLAWWLLVLLALAVGFLAQAASGELTWRVGAARVGRDDGGMDEYREIASEILRTAGGGEAWIERNLSGYLTERCTGCGTDEPVTAMAAGLQWLVEHAAACTVRR